MEATGNLSFVLRGDGGDNDDGDGDGDGDGDLNTTSLFI